MNGVIPHDQAKVEIDMARRLQKTWVGDYGAIKAEANTWMAPTGSDLLPRNSQTERAFADEVRDVVKAGVYGYDPEELRHARRKTLSWQDETSGGALVAPPQMGELVELLRNNEVFLQAGARHVPMPPNGRFVWPRQTGAMTGYYPGESGTITDSTPATGDITLQAKKVAALVKLSNELFRFSSISAEAFVRADIARVLALRMDKELLEGVGSANAPKGLINYAGISSHTAKGTAADAHSGYPLQPEDILQMIAEVEEKNATFKSFVMRPLLWAYVCNKRADAITAADGKGQFMFNVWRDLSDDMNVRRESSVMLSGYPVYKSTQLSNTRTRGNGTTNNTYIVGGDFSDYVISMSPTMEFASTNVGDTAFTTDQTWIRAIMLHDGAPLREASFVLFDQLLTT